MRLVLLYLFLVGIPILGILGILHLGQNLTPPISVGGTWSLEISWPSVADPACGNSPIRSEQPVFTVSQSGPYLLLTFNDPERTTLIGEIRAQRMTAQVLGHGTLAAASDRDAEASATYLDATVDRQAEPDRLQGVLTFTQCSLHTRAPFIAVRQSRGRQ